jgi:hypothetical protein
MLLNKLLQQDLQITHQYLKDTTVYLAIGGFSSQASHYLNIFILNLSTDCTSTGNASHLQCFSDPLTSNLGTTFHPLVPLGDYTVLFQLKGGGF